MGVASFGQMVMTKESPISYGMRKILFFSPLSWLRHMGFLSKKFLIVLVVQGVNLFKSAIVVIAEGVFKTPSLFFYAQNSGLTFLLEEKLQKKSRTCLLLGQRLRCFAKIPAALFLLKKLAENFLTLITRLLPTHCAMCGKRMRNANYKIQNLTLCRFSVF